MSAEDGCLLAAMPSGMSSPRLRIVLVGALVVRKGQVWGLYQLVLPPGWTHHPDYAANPVQVEVGIYANALLDVSPDLRAAYAEKLIGEAVIHALGERLAETALLREG